MEANFPTADVLEVTERTTLLLPEMQLSQRDFYSTQQQLLKASERLSGTPTVLDVDSLLQMKEKPSARRILSGPFTARNASSKTGHT